MSLSHRNARLDALLRQYAAHPQTGDRAFSFLVCLPAIVFAALGMLVAINIGLAMIAIAVAMLYYTQFGQLVAAALGAVLVMMLAIWMLLMPAQHLVAASLGICIAGFAAAAARRLQAGAANPAFSWDRRSILAGPVYALLMCRQKRAGNPG